VLSSKSTSSVSDSGPSPVSPALVWWYGFICFVCLLLIVILFAFLAAIVGLKPPWGFEIACLVLSIHFANWRFVRKHRRAFLSEELKWFAIACGAAFCLYDEIFPLVTRIAMDDVGPIEKAVTILVACLFDFATAAVVVYGTVPWISKFIRTKTV
jgi:hypothetical protein